ncbi:hypothetical protein HY994_04095, partial [Candidatus Micrarchaeota archaeon]|nr:hypothetical protein [Candidatus Micrarchaeota archaeon]
SRTYFSSVMAGGPFFARGVLVGTPKQKRYEKVELTLFGRPTKLNPYKIDYLRKELYELRDSKKLPKTLADDLETQFDGISNLIRTSRNDVGHPSGKKIDRMQAYANLRLFVPYCKRVYALIDFFHPPQSSTLSP